MPTRLKVEPNTYVHQAGSILAAAAEGTDFNLGPMVAITCKPDKLRAALVGRG